MNIKNIFTLYFQVPIDVNIIYSKPGCAHCAHAKELLTVHQVPYQDRSIGEKRYRKELISLMKNRGIKQADITTPEIWLMGQYIGGANELEQYLASTE